MNSKHVKKRSCAQILQHVWLSTGIRSTHRIRKQERTRKVEKNEPCIYTIITGNCNHGELGLQYLDQLTFNLEIENMTTFM